MDHGQQQSVDVKPPGPARGLSVKLLSVSNLGTGKLANTISEPWHQVFLQLDLDPAARVRVREISRTRSYVGTIYIKRMKYTDPSASLFCNTDAAHQVRVSELVRS